MAYNQACKAQRVPATVVGGERCFIIGKFCLDQQSVDTDRWTRRRGHSAFWCANESEDDSASADEMELDAQLQLHLDGCAPIEGDITLGLYKTNGDEVVINNVQVPNADVVEYCEGDLNENGTVDGEDLASVLAYWGPFSDGDVNGDGLTNGQDLASVLGNWGCSSK